MLLEDASVCRPKTMLTAYCIRTRSISERLGEFILGL